MRALVSITALSLLAFAAPAASNPSRQIVVQLRPGATAPGTAAERSAVAAPRHGLPARLAALGLAPISRLEDGLPFPAAPAAARWSARPDPFDLDPTSIWLLEARDSIEARAAIEVLARDPDVLWAEPNGTRAPAVWLLEPIAAHDATRSRAPASERAGPVATAALLPPGFPRDPHFQDSRQWGLRNLGPAGNYGGVAGADIRALEGWALSTGANDVRLAIADTGIDPGHPDLNAAMPGGGMRIERGVNITADPSPAYTDSFGHGTPVAGVAAALTNNAPYQDSLGTAGVCGGDGAANFGCRIVPIKIAPGHSGPATTYDIARAILYATRVGARAMNLSYAGRGQSRLERDALYHAITHGCVVVAAAGNLGATPDVPQYPAAYSAEGLCIQVGASESSGQRAFFSSHGPGLDLMAPGASIWMTFMTYPSFNGAYHRGYVVGSGTSFAAPHVTGMVGLLAAARPELMDTDFQNVIRESADDMGAPGFDRETGWGHLNAARALEAVRPSLGIWHDEVAAQVFQRLPADTLRVSGTSLGTLSRAYAAPAQLIEASAVVALPDSFLDSVRAWPRIGGTTTLRGDFRVPYFAPWSRVTDLDADSFTLRGYLYERTECLSCETLEDRYVPLPADQARFGFTVIGRVDRPPVLALAALASPAAMASAGDTVTLRWSASDPDQVTAIEVGWQQEAGWTPLARLAGDATEARVALDCPSHPGAADLVVVARDEHGRHRDETRAVAGHFAEDAICRARGARTLEIELTPNPFRGTLRIGAPAGARLAIHDIAGRRVRHLVAGASGETFWDGADERGRDAEPGIYWVRGVSGARVTLKKVVRLE